jgi:hypothetical protein
MAFYIDTIEQVKGEEEGTYNEYGKREKWDLPFNQVEAKYFKKLSDVSNDIITEETPDKNHYFMDIRIVDSLGGVKEKKFIGKYQE